METENKVRRYRRIYEQLKKLLAATDNRISRMAAIVALLHHKMDGFFWTGFYQHLEGRLLVGPYQGFLACQDLRTNTGVCWAAVNRKETIIVPDVSRFAGHIACDARSKSEIAVPCIDRAGFVFAVLDVDSDRLNSFDATDAAGLENIAKLLCEPL